MTSKPSTPDSDGPKTETTLTTRIRINIPGSRPIPPVVVRKPVKDTEGSAEPEQGAAAPAPAPVRSALPPAASQGPAPLPTRTPGSAAAPAGRGGGSDEPAGNWFAPRKSTPAPPPAGPREIAPPPSSASYGSAPTAPTPPGGGFAPPPAGPGPVPGSGPRPVGPREPLPARGAFPPGPGTGRGGPGAGPAPVPPPPGVGGPGGAAPQGYPGYDNGPSTEAFPAYTEPGGPLGGGGPAGPTGGPAYGTAPVGADAGPRWPGPEAPPVGPPVPGAAAPGGPRPDGPGAGRGPGSGPVVPLPPQQNRPAPKPKAPAKPAKKQRSKLPLVGGALVALVGVAYGAGLLLNHSDVPKGTTVLGVDITGTRDEAGTKLQAVFGTRAAAPLQLSVAGKQVELKPEKAGLTFDSQTTVRDAAGSDYNPLTVIGSLLGQERVAEPAMPVDEEKLRVALKELAGTAGSATEGTITFDTGKAVAVPGKAGLSLDVDGSVPKVEKAFRDMVATGKASPVELPTSNREPVINQDELNRAMKEFAEPAMSGIATVKAGTKSIGFGSKTLPKILSMQVVDGHLVEKYDLEALKAAYTDTFDGVQITRGTGAKTAVTPQDVVGALRKALRGKTPAERTVVIDTNAG